MRSIGQRDQEGQQDAPDRVKADEYLRRVEAGETPPGSPPAGIDPVRLHRARMSRAERQAETAPPSTWARGNARRTARQARQQLEAAERAAATGEVNLEVASARERRRKKRGGPAANLTDPQSRLMRTAHNGAIQGYNAQVVVSDDHLILATGLHQHGNDYHCYEPMAAAAEAATQSVIDAQPAPEKQTGLETILADAGYFTEDNLTSPGPDRLIALGKNHHVQQEAREHPAAGPPPADASPAEQMRHRLRTPEGAQTYKRRGATVEPVIGHLKDQIGLRRFSRRGLTAAGSELNLAATVVNLLKLHGRGTAHA